jgi:HEAT repeat protein
VKSSEIRKLRTEGDVPALIKAHQAGDLTPRRRQKVVQALASIKTEDSTRALAEIAVGDPDDLTRALAAKELGSPERNAFERGLAEIAMTESPMVLAALANGLANNSAESSLRILAELVAHTDSDVRKFAVDSLISIGGPEVFDSLCVALTDSAWDIRFNAAEAVSASEDPRAVELLENQARSESGVSRLAMREMAAKARDKSRTRD